MVYKRHKIEKQNFPVLNEWKATNEIGLCSVYIALTVLSGPWDGIEIELCG